MTDDPQVTDIAAARGAAGRTIAHTSAAHGGTPNHLLHLRANLTAPT